MKTNILIKSIDIYTLKIPLKKPIKMAGFSVDSAENLFVKITNQKNNYGWGEASSAPKVQVFCFRGPISLLQRGIVFLLHKVLFQKGNVSAPE